MQKVRIIIGRFHRPIFGESLFTALSQHPEFLVERAAGEEELRASLKCHLPTVVILDAAATDTDPHLRPASRNVALIRIEDEGREVQVLLHQIGPDHIRRLAGLVQQCASVQALLPFTRELRRALNAADPAAALGALA